MQMMTESFCNKPTKTSPIYCNVTCQKHLSAYESQNGYMFVMGKNSFKLNISTHSLISAARKHFKR